MVEWITSLASMPQFHMWFTIGLILAAVIAYIWDQMDMEITSLLILACLLAFFHLFPMLDDQGNSLLTKEELLLGFASPALIAVMSLLVVGQAVVRTGALNHIATIVLKISNNRPILAIGLVLAFVVVTSAVLNNTPVVVIFIPILAAMARQLQKSPSSVMIPLSYAAILGGMMTLIGSSTNLLVSGEAVRLGLHPIGFFDFLVPGAVLATVGFVYITVIAPHLLPDRAGLASGLLGEEGPQFIAQLEIESGSSLIGQTIESGKLPDFSKITVRMVQRGEHAFLPPFDESLSLQTGDTLIVAATRQSLTDLLAAQPQALLKRFPEMSEGGEEGDKTDGLSMAEIVIAPASRMIGMTLEQVGFRYHYRSIVLGIQRGQRVIRTRMTEIRLAAGDVLLLMGRQEDIIALKDNKDVLLMEWSTEELPSKTYARISLAIFGAVVSVAALDWVPITISSLIGAVGVILTGCLNLRQAFRSLDAKIIFIVSASLAMSAALQATGGAAFLANGLTNLLDGYPSIVTLAIMFVVMALTTNVLSNNASAVLFAPVAVNTAYVLGIDPYIFLYAVIFACNCSFAAPIGYQTNLLVMAPGHYKFVDFLKVGLPLNLLMCATFVAYAYTFYF